MNATVLKTSSKELRSHVNQLAAIVHTRNLYRGHSRFVYPRVLDGLIVVENLQTGYTIPFVNDGSFRDGLGNPVKL